MKFRFIRVNLAFNITRIEIFFIVFVFCLSLFLNTYRQDELMLFIGDSARDFIAARDMILNGTIPLVGISSSVKWLHQGPISIYLIGVAFLFSGFNPISPAILFGTINAITTVFVYMLSKKIFNKEIGVFASVFFATSPMIVVNARMPYHTSLIPFFTILFFFFLFKTLKIKRYLVLTAFSFGLLLQVELSNIVVLPIIILLFYKLKIKPTKKIIFSSSLALFISLLPFILYEITQGPSYLKFPFWILYRVWNAFLVRGGNLNLFNPQSQPIIAFYQQISSIIYPTIPHLCLVIFFLSLTILFRDYIKTKSESLLLVLAWVLFPLISYSLHGAPGTAYYALLYPVISITLGYLFLKLFNWKKLFLFLFLLIIVSNISILIDRNFFVTTDNASYGMPPIDYNFGSSWQVSDRLAKVIVKDAGGKEITINGTGSISMFETGLDTYKFLIWYRGGKIRPNAGLNYIISPNINAIPKNKKIIYESNRGVILK